MKLNSGVLIVFAIPAAIAAGAPPAFAQAAGPRQGSNALFGGGNFDPKARQKLDLTLSSTEAYNSDMAEEQRTNLGAGGLEPSGYSTMLAGAADYAWRGRRVRVGATGTATLRYLRPIGDILSYPHKSVSHTAGVGFSARILRRTTVLVNQTATYSPSYLYNLFPRLEETTPGDAPAAAPDYAISGAESQSYGTTVTLTHDFSRRSSAAATTEYQSTNALGGTAGGRELSVYGIRGRVSHRLARHTIATAEYVNRLGVARYNSAATTPGTLRGTSAERGVQIGMDYRPQLSATRHVALGARFGASSMMLPESAAGTVLEDRPYSRLSGQVTMDYGFGRTWQTRALYRRGVEYVAGLSEPVSADSFTASVDGLFARRLDFLASVGYSNGESVLNRNSSIFDTYTGDVRLRYALTESFAASIEYLYYFYDSRGSNPLVPGIPPSLERKSVLAGLTLRVPALRR